MVGFLYYILEVFQTLVIEVLILESEETLTLSQKTLFGTVFNQTLLL